ncbi:cytochrome-c peroxidase [Pseudothauera nasutitermitis]|uniref:Cytochrome-c peroxidase n=1 Tax=Pseudothauera nasutitermitis TaxID=2565930 RepID=A0A4S4AZC1_9RHOO|nr:cytochrome c peroxidase [Pseudothauera nasutitermitis]THF64731.1 cytochrome-c peroxidase [Pseudothauera nasutitermitis]
MLFRRLLTAVAVPCALSIAAGPAAASAPSCSTPEGGWEAACLRALYAGDIGTWPRPHGIDERTDWKEMAPIDSLAADAGDEPRARLGKRLFFDPRLSRSDQISCASCHRPEHGFADSQAQSPGHEGRKGKRNAPTVLGAGHASTLFWDGRAASLEEQAAGPIAHPDEMAMPLDELPAKLAGLDDYSAAFARAFAGEARAGNSGAVSLARIAAALAAYQRTLLPPATRFDRFLAGERDALAAHELVGLHLFRTKARCMSCHDGALLSDNRFHNLGLTWYGREYEDLGRYEVTGDPADVGRFRTPTLRQVGQTGPWMHNGRFPSLRGILNMYNAGMPRPGPVTEAQAHDPLFPVTSELLGTLHLTPAELDALEAFLRTL